MARGSVGQAADGTWWCRYDAGTKPDGRRDQRYKGGFASEGAVDAFLVKALHEVNTGQHLRRSNLSLAAYAAEWLTLLDVRPKTADNYRRHLEQVLLPALGPVPLARLRAKQVQVALRGATAHYAESTLALVTTTARMVLGAAVKERLVSPDVLEGWSVKVAAPREHRVLTPEELAMLLDALAADPLAALWELYARTGLRRGEGLGLEWSDLDLGRARLSVKRQAVRQTRGAVRLGPLKTKRSARTIAIDAALVQLLLAHREAQRLGYLAMGAGKPRPDLVFARAPGLPLEPCNISTAFSKAALRAGLAQLRLHDLRHTRATHMLQLGLNPKLVADYLGHDVGMLFKIYAHAFSADQDDAVARLDAQLAAARNRTHAHADEAAGGSGGPN